MNALVLWLLLPLSPTLTLAAPSASDPCRTSEFLKVEKRIPVPNDVNYFMRAAPETGELGFTSGGGNRILDTRSAHPEDLIPLPGRVDPVLSPDGKVIAIPVEWVWDPEKKDFLDPEKTSIKPRYLITGRQAYYCGEDGKSTCTAWHESPAAVRARGEPYRQEMMGFFRKGTRGVERLAIDKQVLYDYQSLGRLKAGPLGNDYRLLFEADEGISYRDYHLDAEGNRFEPKGPVLHACGGLHEATPALSKNGAEFSTYDSVNGITKVYALGSKGADCQPAETIPGQVGKLDFSPDSRHLAFHVDQKSNGLFKVPDSRNQLEVVVYNRESKAWMPVATKADENSYYPVFLGDDRIAFMSATRADSAKDRKFFVNIATIPKRPPRLCPGCFDANTKTAQVAALVGAIRLGQCNKEDKFPFRSALAAFSRLDPDTCLQLVSACDGACLSRSKAGAARSTRRAGLSFGDEIQKNPEQWQMAVVDQLELEGLLDFCRNFRRLNLGTSGDTTPPKDEQKGGIPAD